MKRAALYCRSSKDKADLGLDIQEKELRDFASRNDYEVVAVFSDMELSGSLDETARPGLREMLAKMREDGRKWDTLLTTDTSRIARDQMIAIYVTREAEKAGVDIRYTKMDIDGSGAFGGMMLDVARAFDKLHARLSAEKGRAGSEANVAKGYRAGGAAPFGYKLHKETTGAVRGGEAVGKTRLVPVPKEAALLKAFLQARAEGQPRNVAAKLAGLEQKAVASLVAFERNALTYAGYTVWNQRQKIKPTRDDPRKTMRWRPRAEWIITDEPTHEALITREQAERILALHSDDHKRHSPRVRNPDAFLLSGLLFTPDGKQWHGDTCDKAYRAGSKGRRISAPWIESEVVARIGKDFRDADFLARIVNEAHTMAMSIESDPTQIDAAITEKQRQIANLLDVAADTGDKAVLGRIRDLEAAVVDLRNQKAEWAERAALKDRLMNFDSETAKHVHYVLGENAAFLAHPDDKDDEASLYCIDIKMPRPTLRRMVTTLIKRIELDADSRRFVIHYTLPITGVNLATPRGVELYPAFSAVVRVDVPHNKRQHRDG